MLELFLYSLVCFAGGFICGVLWIYSKLITALRMDDEIPTEDKDE